MSKFKIGDAVVVTKVVNTKDVPVGTLLTIKRISTENSIKHGQAYGIENQPIGYYESQLEYSVIYNSPLYQALK